jgi:hypothetical protein
VAEREVKKRYRFGRLWIISSQYNMDGQPVRIANVMGVPGADEADGGLPKASRYITRNSNPYRLPSMDTNYLINDVDPFRRYLEEAPSVTENAACSKCTSHFGTAIRGEAARSASMRDGVQRSRGSVLVIWADIWCKGMPR